MDLKDRIESIYLKTKELALKVERLQKENKILKKENQDLKTSLEKREAGIRQLETRLEAISEQQDPELKTQIDYYIQEIDKCIAWLQKQ